MIRSTRHTTDSQRPRAMVTDEHKLDDVRVLKEIVSALCERVELLEAQALLIRPLLVARALH